MATDSTLTLDRQLCFALYNASKAFTNLYRPLLEDLGLTYPQYLVMLVLWERESLTVKELGSALRLDSGTLSPLLKRLQARGLLTRQRTEEDERSVAVAITDDGRALRQQARGIPERVVSATGMEIAEAIELRTTLHELTSALDAATRRESTERETQR